MLKLISLWASASTAIVAAAHVTRRGEYDVWRGDPYSAPRQICLLDTNTTPGNVLCLTTTGLEYVFFFEVDSVALGLSFRSEVRVFFFRDRSLDDAHPNLSGWSQWSQEGGGWCTCNTDFYLYQSSSVIQREMDKGEI